MEMLVDIIVVVIVLAFILVGWKRGFLLSVYALFSMIVAVALACVLSPAVSAGLEKTGLQDKLETKIAAYVETELTEKFGENADISTEEAAEELPLPSFLTGKIAEDAEESAASPIKSVSERVGIKSAELICGVIAFILIFFIVMVIMMVLKIILKLASKLPVLKQADAVGGVLIGFVQGVLFICVLALLLSVFSSTQSMRGIVSAVEDSHIAKYIYENNFIGQIISRLF